MVQKVNVPLLGVAENMSYFLDPSGQKHALFGESGGQKTADSLGTILIGQVPLIQEIRAGGDAGKPIVVSSPDSAAAKIFRDIGDGILSQLARKVAPTTT